MESRRWKDALESLEPHQSSIKVFGTPAHRDAKKATIYANLKQTLPLVESNYKPNCGRLLSSDGNKMLYSNKGGNCVPFDKMNELLYRLEFETSASDIGTQRGSSGGAAATKFGERFCQEADKLANTMYSFRQIAYQWNHARPPNASFTAVSIPTVSTLLTDFANDENTQSNTATALVNQLFSHPNGGTKTVMCNIDWTQELVPSAQTIRKDFAGSEYENPYLLFDREINEAIFNTRVAVQAKRRAATDNKNLWSAVEAELTSVDKDRLNSDIAHEAAEHFMRIVTTDTDDVDVDSVEDLSLIHI